MKIWKAWVCVLQEALKEAFEQQGYRRQKEREESKHKPWSSLYGIPYIKDANHMVSKQIGGFTFTFHLAELFVGVPLSEWSLLQ